MTRLSRTVGYIAFSLMMIFTLIAVPFVVAEMITDPGGWAAVGMAALFLVPLIGLSVVALLRPAPTAWALGVGAALVAAYAVVDAATDAVPRGVGPVVAVACVAIGIPMAFLGLRRPLAAGVLLLVTGAVAVGDSLFPRLFRDGEPGFGFGSSGAIAVPLLVVGGLFLLAGGLGEARRKSELVGPGARPLPH